MFLPVAALTERAEASIGNGSKHAIRLLPETR
jgi:hypothetical protein